MYANSNNEIEAYRDEDNKLRAIAMPMQPSENVQSERWTSDFGTLRAWVLLASVCQYFADKEQASCS